MAYAETTQIPSGVDITFRPTVELRYIIRELPMGIKYVAGGESELETPIKKVLQQKYIGIEYGTEVWQDVPTIFPNN